jgi:hypothetical protein
MTLVLIAITVTLTWGISKAAWDAKAQRLLAEANAELEAALDERDLEWARRTARRDHAVHALLEAWPSESGTPVECWETPELQAAYDSERDRLDGVL